MASSSSTTRTSSPAPRRGGAPAGFCGGADLSPLGRQVDLQGGPLAGRACDGDEAAVALDYFNRGREPESGSLADALGGEKGVENPIDDAGRDAVARVGDRQEDVELLRKSGRPKVKA